MIRTALSVIAAALVVIASASPAAGAPIFPPLVSGQYAFGVVTAAAEVDGNGVPTHAPSRSVGVYNVLDPGTLLLCQAAGPTGYGERIDVSVTVPAVGDRAELRAVAFADDACLATPSEPCDDGAYVFFTPPARPAITP